MTEELFNNYINKEIGQFIFPFLIFTLILIVFKIVIIYDFWFGLIIILGILSLLIKQKQNLFYLFIISLPFSGETWMYDFLFHIKISYLTFCFVFISFIYEKIRKQDFSITITSIDFPLFLFLLVAVISVFQTAYISKNPFIILGAFRNYPWIKGISRILLLIFMIIIYYVTVDIIKEKEVFKKSLIFFIITSVLVSLYGIIGYTLHSINSSLYLSLFAETMTMTRIKSVFNEPLFLGNYLLSIIPLVYCLLVARVKYIKNKFLFISAIILTITLFLTESRGAWFGYIVFMLIFIIVYWRILFKVALTVSVYLVLLFVFILLIDFQFFNCDLTNNINTKSINIINAIYFPLAGAIDPTLPKFWSTRVRVWSIESAFNLFKQYPILGIGYSNYGFYSGMRVYKGLYPNAINISEVNNYPVSVLVEMGLVGLMVLLWLTWRIFKNALYKLFHEFNNVKRTLIIGYALCLLGICAHLMFFSYIMSAYIWVMLGMMMSLCDIKTIIIKRLP